MLLEVHQQCKGDVYRDVVRIPERHRKNKGRIVPEGTIVKLSVSGGASTVVWLRGMGDTAEAWIRMDDKTRNDLGVATMQEHHFSIENACICRKIGWALNSSDPALSIATWIAVTSVVLSAIGFFLSVFALCFSLAG